MGRKERIEIIEKIQKMRNSLVFCILTSDRPNISVQLQKDILPKFASQLKDKGKVKNIDLFIFTHGGDTLAGFGLSRLLREYADNVNILVPDCCHSAGTLIALGSNQIIMTPAATLSPIDPSISRPLNPAIQLDPNQPPQLIPLSVESVASYGSLIRNEWKVKNQNNYTQLFRILSEKVHPLALGDVYRARQQIELLAKELLLQHRNDKRNIEKIIHTLSKDLGSHDYLIFRKEAKKLLGDQVVIIPELENLIWDLYVDFTNEMELGIPFDPSLLLIKNAGPLPNGPLTQISTRSINAEIKLAMIESIERGHQAVKKVKITENLIPQGINVARNISLQDTFAGWEAYT
jgi:hypothetical protein